MLLLGAGGVALGLRRGARRCALAACCTHTPSCASALPPQPAPTPDLHSVYNPPEELKMNYEDYKQSYRLWKVRATASWPGPASWLASAPRRAAVWEGGR